MKIYHIFKNSNIEHNLLIVKISAIKKDLDQYLRFSLHVLNISREGTVSQICYLGPSSYFMKC